MGKIIIRFDKSDGVIFSVQVSPDLRGISANYFDILCHHIEMGRVEVRGELTAPCVILEVEVPGSADCSVIHGRLAYPEIQLRLVLSYLRSIVALSYQERARQKGREETAESRHAGEKQKELWLPGNPGFVSN